MLSRYRLIFMLLLGLLCAALLLNRHLVPAGDNATYMILGQSLVTGRGYRMISDPRSPEMSLYPPGYPLLLAGVLAATGTAGNLLAAVLPLKLLSLALYLGATAVAYGMLRRRSVITATMTMILVVVSPHILHFATEVSTEIPYLFLSLCCLWLIESYQRRPSVQALLCVAASLVLTFYVRSVALVVAVAFALHLCVERKARHALLLLVVVGMLVAPWFIRSSLLPSTGTSIGLGRGYFSLYFSSDPYSTERAGLLAWVTRLFQNLRIYALDIVPAVLFPHVLSAAALGPAAPQILGGAMSALVMLGFILEARRGHATEWYVVLFFASCVAYPWAQSRLMVPVIAFSVFYFVTGVGFALQWVLRRSRGQAREYALPLVCSVLLLSMLRVDVRSVQTNLRSGLGHSLTEHYAGDSEWSNYLRAIEWIAADSPQLAVVMCRKADLLYLLTGHQALEYPYSADGIELMHSVQDNHVAYVIEDAFTWTRTTPQYLRPALREWLSAEPAALSPVYETDAPRTRVWRVNYSGNGDVKC